MNCPVCNTPLTEVNRQGIEIDYCTTCRGVWLDRGELEKLIERSQQHGGYDNDDDSDWGDDRRRHNAPPQGHYPPKKTGFFGRMFDFD
jgi:uncharacterized protein